MYVYVMYRVCHVQYMYAQYTAEDWGFFLFFTIFTFYLCTVRWVEGEMFSSLILVFDGISRFNSISMIWLATN